MNGSPRARRNAGSFPSPQERALGSAQSTLDRDGQIIVIALCAERALVSLHLNPARYYAFDVGPVDDNDPLNTAHYYRVRQRLPNASS